MSSEVKDLLVKAAGNGNGNADNGVYPAAHNPSVTGNLLVKKPTQQLRKSVIARYLTPVALKGHI